MANKTKKTEKDIVILKSLVQTTLKSIKKVTGKKAYSIEEMEAMFGVPDYISTGLPHFDLYLPHSSDRSAYGFPYGRVTEIHGENSSFKTTMLLATGAKNLAKNGITYSATCEMDYDASFVKKFIEEEGLDFKSVKDNWVIQPVKTVKDFYLFVRGIIDPIKEIADELESKGLEPMDHIPRIVITLDSLGALIGEVNNDRLEEDWDKGDQMGSFAGEMHKFFQYFLYDLGRLGIMFIFSNHFRDNLGFGNKKNLAAHDSSVKFYASLRLETKLGYNQALSKAVTRDKISYKAGVPLKIKIFKARTNYVCDGELEVDYYYNHGFDYLGSLLQACRMSSIMSEKAGVYEFALPEGDEDFAKITDKKFGAKEIRDTLKSDAKLMIKLENLAYKRGPRQLEDMR